MPARCSQLDWHDRPRECSLASARTLAATFGAPILRKGEITYLFACFSVRGWGCVMARHAAASAPTTPWSLVRSRNHLPGDDLPTGPVGAKVVTRVCCLGVFVCLALRDFCGKLCHHASASLKTNHCWITIHDNFWSGQRRACSLYSARLA